jgi:HAD superfamily hydrolase (TIGR01490 family)
MPAGAAETVAIFDLDGTITRHDTYLAFLLFVLARRPHRLAHCIAQSVTVLRFALGRASNDDLKRCLLRAVAGGLDRPSLDTLADRFAEQCCARMVKPAARQRIAWHRSQGHRLILATASLDLTAERIGQRLGFDATLATRAAWHDGRITGELASANLRGDHKLAAIQALYTACPMPHVFAYSDHHSDLPLLRFADHPTAVDPTRRLADSAQASGMAIEHWGRTP